ncbi:PREDICTED: doublecortin domain-containing protein 2-like, partial [Acanthisitta chloris]|uniref:doublecortin domain-containing protein 2-like n=1 Tax=Acanthisitta chloris TaxID=57068 RepID=UPI0004F0D61A
MTSPGTKGSWLSQPTVKSVLVYRNGDPFFPGRRIVIHEKKVSNFDVFLKEVTGGVKAPFGAVRNIYTPRGGHRVRQLEELQSGEQYVAGGREAFKKLNYLDIGETKKKPAEVNNEVKPVTHSRITVSARFRKPLQEPYTIFLIANGDLISPAVRLLIPRKTLNHWDHILEMVTGRVTLRSGAVHRLTKLPSLMQFHLWLFKKEIIDHPHQNRDISKKYERGDNEKTAFRLARLCMGMGYSSLLG